MTKVPPATSICVEPPMATESEPATGAVAPSRDSSKELSTRRSSQPWPRSWPYTTVVPSASVFVWSFRDSPPAAGVGAEGGVDGKLACTLPRWATPVHQIHPSLLGTAGDVASVGHANMVAATAPPDGTATLTPVTSTAAVPHCTPSAVAEIDEIVVDVLLRWELDGSCFATTTGRRDHDGAETGGSTACCERDEAGLH